MSGKPLLLGVSASLRNARWGNEDLCRILKSLNTEDELMEYLKNESEGYLEIVLKAGREEGLSFLETYKNLKKNKGNKGLSNSEIALASSLWAAHHVNGVDIGHLSLCEFFKPSGRIKNGEKLKAALLSCDGLIVSSPVYFGDRGSLAQSLLNFIRRDPEIKSYLKGKIIGGIAVGAKRNGGQETTLIYQMLDYLRSGLLAVGNDDKTTAQYGGTGHAGDVGSMHKDTYGLNTSMGVGRRVGSLLHKASISRRLEGPVKLLFLILQDRREEALNKVKQLLDHYGDQVEATIVDVANQSLQRCIACDFCPTKIDADEVYRCIIASDDLKHLHEEFLYHDAIVPVTLSVEDPEHLVTNYQTFIERTRYLRRGDYVFSNQLVAPLCFEEVGFGEDYHIRLITSFVRHHMVVSKPMIGCLEEDKLVNQETVYREFGAFIESVRQIGAIRLAEIDLSKADRYNPIGYVLSADKDREDERMKVREKAISARYDAMRKEAETRLTE